MQESEDFPSRLRHGLAAASNTAALQAHMGTLEQRLDRIEEALRTTTASASAAMWLAQDIGNASRSMRDDLALADSLARQANTLALSVGPTTAELGKDIAAIREVVARHIRAISELRTHAILASDVDGAMHRLRKDLDGFGLRLMDIESKLPAPLPFRINR